jgi:hypothetical protein
VLLVSASLSEELQQLRHKIDDFTDQSIIDFMTGKRDPSDDTQWAAYQQAYETMGSGELIRGVQAEYANHTKSQVSPYESQSSPYVSSDSLAKM